MLLTSNLTTRVLVNDSATMVKKHGLAYELINQIFQVTGSDTTICRETSMHTVYQIPTTFEVESLDNFFEIHVLKIQDNYLN